MGTRRAVTGPPPPKTPPPTNPALDAVVQAKYSTYDQVMGVDAEIAGMRLAIDVLTEKVLDLQAKRRGLLSLASEDALALMAIQRSEQRG